MQCSDYSSDALFERYFVFLCTFTGVLLFQLPILLLFRFIPAKRAGAYGIAQIELMTIQKNAAQYLLNNMVGIIEPGGLQGVFIGIALVVVPEIPQLAAPFINNEAYPAFG